MTSTIASHLPRAVGMALAIDRAARLGVTSPWQRRRDRPLLVRRRLAQPRDRAGGAQHDGADARSRASRCRSSSCARTTGSGSASRRRPAGSSRRSPPGPRSATRSRTGTTPPRCSESRASSPDGCASGDGRPFSTSARCATSATRARTRRWRTGRRRRSAPTTSATRSSAPRAGSCLRGARAGEELANDYLAARDEARELALEVDRAPADDLGGAGHGAARAALARQSSPRRRAASASRATSR